MNYFIKLDKLNWELLELRKELNYLIANVDELSNATDTYFKKLGDYPIYNAKLAILKEAQDIENKIINLNNAREEVIRKILRASFISAADMIYLFDEFKSYHKLIKVGIKNLIVPQDFNLISTGEHSIMSEEEYNQNLEDYLVPMGNGITAKPKKSAYDMPMYVRKSINTGEGIKEEILVNDQILTCVAGLEVNDLEGIQIYIRDNNGIRFNPNVLNLLPYDIIAFLDFYITKRLEILEFNIYESNKEKKSTNSSFGIREAMKLYKENNEIIGLSYDDPALEDLYRSKRGRK